MRREDDCVLAATTASGEVRLPSIELNGWEPVGTQVQRWLDLTARMDNAASDSGDKPQGTSAATITALPDTDSLAICAAGQDPCAWQGRTEPPHSSGQPWGNRAAGPISPGIPRVKGRNGSANVASAT